MLIWVPAKKHTATEVVAVKRYESQELSGMVLSPLNRWQKAKRLKPNEVILPIGSLGKVRLRYWSDLCHP